MIKKKMGSIIMTFLQSRGEKESCLKNTQSIRLKLRKHWKLMTVRLNRKKNMKWACLRLVCIEHIFKGRGWKKYIRKKRLKRSKTSLLRSKSRFRKNWYSNLGRTARMRRRQRVMPRVVDLLLWAPQSLHKAMNNRSNNRTNSRIKVGLE
jgi:hypothetical protein